MGSVRGGPQYDDAWDEGALLSMMARNNMRPSGASNVFQLPARKFPGCDPRNQSLSAHLHPTMAMVEGLPDAMAAIALKTPYLTSASGTAVRDVRNKTGLPLDVFSGPAIAAFAWELALKVSGVAWPGNPETWADITPALIIPLCSLTYELGIDEGKDFATHRDVPSLFTQLRRMSLLHGETLTEEALTQMTTPYFGAVWPRPEDGPLSCFIADWGSDPDSAKEAVPGFPLGMSDSTLDAEGRFSNLTAKENHTAKLALTKDTAYWLSVAPAPSLPGGASIEVRIVECAVGSDDARTISSGSAATLSFSHPNPQRVVLRGASDGTLYHLLHFSLKSPTSRVANAQVSVRLDPAR
jgi:hypothetical protein